VARSSWYRELCPVHRGLIAMSGSLDGMWGQAGRTPLFPSDEPPDFLLQPLDSLPQELPLWFLLGQRQSFLIRGPSLSGPAEPAAHIGAG